MAIGYDPFLRLALPDIGNQAWGTAVNQNFSSIAAIMCPQEMYYVSPHFTDANIHTAGATTPRYFSTIQAAIDAAPASTGYFVRTVIVVYPGVYYENLSITKSVCIRAKFPAFYRALGGAGGTQLAGTTSVQAPTITITPPNGVTMAVSFMGLHIDNEYNAAATTITNAQILKVNKQTVYGGSEVVVGFQDCDIRAQTWGAGNDWAYGLWLAGFNQLVMRRCSVSGSNYAGGTGVGGIAHLFYLTGDNANGKAASLRVVRSDIAQSYTGARFSGNLQSTVFVNDKANAVFGRCSVQNTAPGIYTTIGTTGTNSVAGLAGDSTSYGNTLGVDLSLL